MNTKHFSSTIGLNIIINQVLGERKARKKGDGKTNIAADETISNQTENILKRLELLSKP